MSRVSLEFGRQIQDILQRHGLTFRAAALKSSVSAAYWKDMSDGRVPSESVIRKVASSFEDVEEGDLLLAAGYFPHPDTVNPVKAVELALRGQTSIPDEGKRQILDLVRRIELEYGKD